MTARLVGGPFDGDFGALREVPSPTIFVVACPAPARCGQGGTHWFRRVRPGLVRYALVTLDEQGARYEYGDLLAGGDQARAREKERVAA